MEIMVGDFGYLSILNLIEGTVSIMIAVKIMLTAIMTKSFDFCIKRRSIYRGYYTVARRYEFYVRVARTISHE